MTWRLEARGNPHSVATTKMTTTHINKGCENDTFKRLNMQIGLGHKASAMFFFLAYQVGRAFRC